MKTIELNLVKKNRVYFACTNDRGYSVKLKIDEVSKDLELGKHTLLVEDISIRSKYGVDVIYAMQSDVKSAGIVTLQHEYNENLVKKCRELGGRWDGEAKAWVFSDTVSDAVEDLDVKYNTDRVLVEITTKYDLCYGQATADFLGYVLAKATGRDSGARLGDYPMLKGSVGSGGSMKNWTTEISEGTTFRLTVSRNLLRTRSEKNIERWDVKELTAE